MGIESRLAAASVVLAGISVAGHGAEAQDTNKTGTRAGEARQAIPRLDQIPGEGGRIRIVKDRQPLKTGQQLPDITDSQTGGADLRRAEFFLNADGVLLAMIADLNKRVDGVCPVRVGQGDGNSYSISFADGRTLELNGQSSVAVKAPGNNFTLKLNQDADPGDATARRLEMTGSDESGPFSGKFPDGEWDGMASIRLREVAKAVKACYEAHPQ